MFIVRYPGEAPGLSVSPERNKEPYNLDPRTLWVVAFIDTDGGGGKEKNPFLSFRWGKRDMVPSIVILTDLKDEPSVRMELPALLPLGERIKLRLLLRRKNGHRTEELRVEGEYRVTESSVDATYAPAKQILKVEATKVAPSWKAVRNPVAPTRVLPPTHSKAIVDE